MSAMHTPGPWEVDEFTDLTPADGPRRISLTIAHLWHDEEGTHTDNVAEVVMDYHDPAVPLANARLLAAAPDMEDALKQILAFVTGGCDQDDRIAVIECCKSALSKAWCVNHEDVTTPEVQEILAEIFEDEGDEDEDDA